MIKSVYMLGVAGMGMAPLAICLVQSGVDVVGFDDSMSYKMKEMLENAGVTIEDYPRREVNDLSEIVYSSAFKADHPIIIRANEIGIPCTRRGAKLSQLVKEKKLVAICGSHGKTTCSAMIVHMLRSFNFEFSYLVGGLWSDPTNEMIPGSWSPNSEWIVAEIDESDGTIDEFSPEILVILNLDYDHSSYYKNVEDLRSTFMNIIKRTKSNSLIEEGCKDWLPSSLNKNISTFSSRNSNDEKNGNDFRQVNGSIAKKVSTLLFGKDPGFTISDFKGIARRNNTVYQDESVKVVEDYAHHPVELKAFFDLHDPDDKSVVVFQPHRYSRTLEFKDEFANVLKVCRNLIVLPVYSASEDSLVENIDSLFFQAVQETSTAPIFCENLERLNDLLMELLGNGIENIYFLGAGDIEHWCRCFALYYQKPNISSWLSAVQSGLTVTQVVQENYSVASKTTLRVGGVARFYIEPETISDLQWTLQVSKLFGLDVFILGRGSNLIISDKGFDGVIIKLNKGQWAEIKKMDDHRLFAGSGVRLKELCGKASLWGMAGFEFLEGIPGSVGGSLRMNAGAMGSWIFDIVESVYFIDVRGKLSIMDKEKFHVEYRRCKEIAEGIALGAIFKAQAVEETAVISTKMHEFSSQRKSTQPKEPSAGCIFKNPTGGHAGKMIDEQGLKGFRIGDAEVSHTHGNFIINRGNASSEDVISLVKHVRNEIHIQTGIMLEPEVLLLGEDWEAVLKSE